MLLVEAFSLKMVIRKFSITKIFTRFVQPFFEVRFVDFMLLEIAKTET